MLTNRLPLLIVLVITCTTAGILLGMKISSAGAASSASPQHAGHNHAHETSTSSAGADWCAEHRFPESECTLCHPDLIVSFKADGNWCNEHNLPESHCRKCNPTLVFPQEPHEPIEVEPVGISVYFPPNRVGCTSNNAVVRFATAETADRIGLKVEPVVQANSLPILEAPAEIVPDETRVQAVAIAVPATLIRWLVEPGEKVTASQPLVELQSPEMASLKAQYLSAIAGWSRDQQQHQRASELYARGMLSQAEMDEFDAIEKTSSSLLRGIEAQLRSLGLNRSDLDSLTANRDANSNWQLRSAIAATVIERRVAPGVRLEAGATLAVLGDFSAFWIQAHVREQDMSRFRLGDKIEFAADGESLSRVTGEVIWISQYLEPDTRTGVVRARVTGNNSLLRANMFGRAFSYRNDDAITLLVPKDAVQWEGCCNIAFVQEAADRYRPTKVTVQRGDNHYYRLESGLRAGDLVVTNGSFLLKSELKRESLGVGCAGE